MHEYSIAESLLKAMLKKAEEHNLTKVTGAKVKVGILKMVTEDALQGAFDIVAKGTNAEGAKLDIQITPSDELTLLEIEGE